MRVITAENLSKEYLLGARQPYSFREMLTGVFNRGDREAERHLWALRDVSFSVDEGERLGLIGHNGAGKSTLLKILSRITKPTRGRAEIRGRVGSLLEVGTGFHSELSGRENIYLNGAILGMKRAEIDKKFDEIVAFSEIEAFLDTPVKHYSTGMYMRLAFSVAAHLDPEVLIVDEVLAVGDVGFQKKCLRKMRDVGESGRTVIFVSHDMQAVTRLCSRVIWLQSGKIFREGETLNIVSEYWTEETRANSTKIWEDIATAPGNDVARLRQVRICDETGNGLTSIEIDRPVFIEMTYEVLANDKVLMPNFHLYDVNGICVFVSHDLDDEWRNRRRQKGVYRSRARIPGNSLAEGAFSVTPALTTYEPMNVHFLVRDAVSFLVRDKMDGTTARGDFSGPMPGVARPILEWETKLVTDEDD